MGSAEGTGLIDPTEQRQQLVDELIDARSIVCPDCAGALSRDPAVLTCVACGGKFPVARGVPILLHSDSVFDADEIADRGRGTYFSNMVRESPLKRRLRRRLPSLTKDRTATRVDAAIRARGAGCTGLVVGAGEPRRAMTNRVPEVRWLTTDVDLAFTPGAVADVTRLPFDDGTFDVVIAEMVLEHVIDLKQAAQELQRVCATGGLVIATVPFCFPWHGVPFDFFRCSPTGLRALFDETTYDYLGSCQGSGSATAYAASSLIVNLSSRRHVRWGLLALSRLLLFPLKHLDNAARGGNRFVAAGALTYIGTKADRRLTPKELVDEVAAIFHGGTEDVT